MNRDQESSGFLPLTTTTTTTNELRHQPPSPTTTLTGNNPHHLPGFTKLNVPPTVTGTTTHLATTLRREILPIPSTSFRDAVTATNAANSDQEHPPTTTTTSTPQKARETPRKNPLRRTLSDTTSTIRKPDTPGPGSSNRSESPQFKKLKKMGDEVRAEFGGKGEGVEDDNPSKVIVGEEEEEEEVRGEFVEFRRLEDGSLSIKVSCSCGDCFEFVRNRIGCFYRLSI